MSVSSSPLPESSEDPPPVPLAVLDFEASCLPCPGSYPIEVAVAYVDSGDTRSWLIRPEPAWLEGGKWDPAAERLHGISPAMLEADGRPADEVRRGLRAAVEGHSVLTDGASGDSYWLSVLFDGDPPVRIEPLRDFLVLAAGDGPAAKIVVDGAVELARTRFPTIHRAEPDARRGAEAIRIICGLDIGGS
jgi:hypothetical protein